MNYTQLYFFPARVAHLRSIRYYTGNYTQLYDTIAIDGAGSGQLGAPYYALLYVCIRLYMLSGGASGRGQRPVFLNRPGPFFPLGALAGGRSTYGRSRRLYYGSRNETRWNTVGSRGVLGGTGNGRTGRGWQASRR